MAEQANSIVDWNYGDMLDALALAIPAGQPALIHDGRVISWGEFDKRTNNLAANLLAAGLKTGDKVAFYLRNGPAYSELLSACFKARLVHVNVNYRYLDDELAYIVDNSDAAAVVYSAEFAGQAETLQGRSAKVRVWLEVGDPGEAPRNPFAKSFDSIADDGAGAPLSIERSGDDLLFLYTGGTTGMPKGVMWTQRDQWLSGTAGASPATGGIAPSSLAEHIDNVRAYGGPILVPCCPQMHGTGLFTTIGALMSGGTVVTLTAPSFDPAELFDVIEQHGVTSLAIVGDAFAKPMVRVLDENPGRWDLSSLQGALSSGVMWSPEVKQALLKHAPQMVLTDSFGASEAVGFGRSDTTIDGGTEVARFMLGEHCKVFSESFEEILPGSEEVGFVARGGAIPLGYYKDEEKTAKTFPVINGLRYSIPGDYCRVEADGTLILLGRGSVCINTAGEKVYPEEVEEVLKTHDDVVDALVVGLPDDKWGQMVTAVVQLEPGATFDEDVLRQHVRGALAGYKTPKAILAKDDLGRASNGKADYKAITAYARSKLGR